MLVSIITPTYNSEKYIEETIKSVLHQSHKHFEHIIVDGLSTDSTLKILSKYKHLKVFQGKDNNMYEAINKGIKIANGEIIAYLNSDDLYYLNTIENVVKAFKSNPESLMLYGDCTFINSQSQEMYTYRLPEFNLKIFSAIKRMIVYQQSCFWRKDVHSLIGLFDESFNYSADYDFFCRLFETNRVKHIPVKLAKFRVHSDSLSENNNGKMQVEKEIIDKKYKTDSILISVSGKVIDYLIIKSFKNIPMIFYKLSSSFKKYF